MMWVTWRQQRLETLIGGTLLALVAAFLLKTGLDIAAGYQHTGAAACVARQARDAGCMVSETAFQDGFGETYPVYVWSIFLPLVFGLLLAAPFVLELEQGAYRLTWTQSITRTRWMAIKLGLIVAAAILVGLTLGLLMMWWNAPFDRMGGQLNRNPFELEGTAPMAYTVYAVAVCLVAGTLLRRTVPALALTLVGFLALRIAIELRVHAYYLPPLTKAVPLALLAAGQRGVAPGDYIIDQQIPAPTDHLPHATMQLCQGGFPSFNAQMACLAHHAPGIHALLTYQPAERFWLFQGIESAIFLVPAVALLALTAWWIKYRIA